MPKQYSQAIQQNPAYTPVSDFQRENVVAAPISTLVTPADSPGMRLADALKGLQPGLTKYIDNGLAQNKEDQKLLGAKGRMEQAGSASVLSSEQDPYYQQGYMEMHGKIAGAESSREMLAAYDEHKNDPGFNMDAFTQQHVGQDMQGMTDPDALKGYMPEVMKAQEALKSDYLQMNVQQHRDNTISMGMADARNISEASYLKGGATQGDYQGYLAAQAKNGITTPEASTMFLQASRQFGDQGYPEAYDVFLKPDANGVAPIDNPKLAPGIREAIHAATTVRDQKLKAEAAKSNLASWTDTETRIKGEDPSLSVQEVFNNPSLSDTEKKSFIPQVLELQHTIDTKRRALTDIMSGNVRFGSLPDKDRGVYQQQFDEYGNKLLATVGQGGATVGSVIGNIATLSAKNGMPFTPLKQLLSTIDTDIPTDKAGSVPPNFTKAVQYYQALKQVNPALAISYTSDGSRAMMDAYSRAKQNDQTSDADAFAKARKLADPEVRKQATEFVSTHSKQINDAVTSELGKFAGTGFLGMGKEQVRNIEQVRQYIRSDLASNPSAAYLDTTEAIKASIDKFKGMNVSDGNGHYVYSGGNPGEKFTPALKFYTDSFKLAQDQKYGAGYSAKRGDTFLVNTGNGTYQMFDQLGAISDAAPITQKELVDKYEQATSKATQQQLQLKATVLGVLSDPKKAGPTPEDQLNYMNSNGGKITDLHRTGALSTEDYNRFIEMRGKLKDDKWMTMLKTQITMNNSEFHQGMTQEQTNPVSLTAPLTNPGGGNPSSLALANRYVNDDPTFALTAAVEGVRLGIYQDPAGGRNISMGYNIDHRGEAQARKDFRRAGIPDTLTESLLSKDPNISHAARISPDQNLRLYSIIRPEYEKTARTAVEEVTGLKWEGLQEHQKAALTYLAYATGNVKQYRQVLGNMKAGKMDEAANAMSLNYTDGKTGERKSAARAVELTRSMFLSTGRFSSILNHISTNSDKAFKPYQFGSSGFN